MTDEERQLFNELLRKLVGGDRLAYDEIYQKFRCIIYSYILSIIKNKHDAEDLTQDTFLELLKPTFSIRDLKNPSAYVFEVAKNKTYDFLRRVGKNKEFISLYIRDILASQNVHPEEEVQFTEIFSTLSGDEKMLIELRYSSGYKVYEIAKNIGVSKRTINRAFKEIKQKLRRRTKELLA